MPSCGCLTRHGLVNTRIYRIWSGIKTRCLNPNHRSYKYYGARGIKMCKEWLRFMSFYQWVNSSNYQENLTIERSNNDGNYEPDNCIWIPLGEQGKNKRQLKFSETGLAGIHRYKTNGKYFVKVVINGKRKQIGTYNTLIEAKNKRDKHLSSI